MSIERIQNLDDDALGQVLAEAFDALPEPSAMSLRRVRDQLPLKQAAPFTNRPSIHWRQLVLIGILSGSGLAFAWWGIERFFSPADSSTETMAPVINQTAPVPHQDHSNNQLPAGSKTGNKDDRRSPVIFQQEQY